MTKKDQLIEFLNERVKQLEAENELLRKPSNKKAIKNKWGKVPYRKRHLKLIAINGLPLKGGAL